MSEREVAITDDDVRFVERAREHYQVFAETYEKEGGEECARIAGSFRSQEFYAERFLLRIRTGPND